jgi:TPR repeat protein
MGWMYATGRGGVTREVPRAIAWYQRAIKDKTALRHIALLKNDPEARPVPPPRTEADLAEFVHIRGLGHGRWSEVSLVRSSNGFYYAEKIMRTYELDVKRDEKLNSSFTEAEWYLHLTSPSLTTYLLYC